MSVDLAGNYENIANFETPPVRLRSNARTSRANRSQKCLSWSPDIQQVITYPNSQGPESGARVSYTVKRDDVIVHDPELAKSHVSGLVRRFESCQGLNYRGLSSAAPKFSLPNNDSKLTTENALTQVTMRKNRRGLNDLSRRHSMNFSLAPPLKDSNNNLNPPTYSSNVNGGFCSNLVRPGSFYQLYASNRHLPSISETTPSPTPHREPNPQPPGRPLRSRGHRVNMNVFSIDNSENEFQAEIPPQPSRQFSHLRLPEQANSSDDNTSHDCDSVVTNSVADLEMSRHCRESLSELKTSLDKVLQAFQLVSNDPELSHEEREQLMGMLTTGMSSSQYRIASALGVAPGAQSEHGEKRAANQAAQPGQEASVLLEQYSNMLLNMLQHKMANGQTTNEQR